MVPIFAPFVASPFLVIGGWTEVSRDVNENSKVSEKANSAEKIAIQSSLYKKIKQIWGKNQEKK